MINKRNITVDILKGWAIITVVLVHVFRGKGITDIIIGEIARWAVPAFFMIQGFYMHRTAQKPWLQSAVKKIKKVYVPFVIYSAAYGFYFLWFDGKAFTVLDVLLGETAVHLYYIAHYMVFALCFPLLYRLPKQYRNYCLWFAVLSNFGLCVVLELQRAYGLHLITYSGFNPTKWWGFVALGMLTAERQTLQEFLKNHRNTVVFGAIFLVCMGILLPFWTGRVGYMYNRWSLFPLAIGMTVLVVAFWGQENVPGRHVLSYIGQRSFGIYLLHFFIVHILKYIVGIKNLWLVVVLTMMICLAVLELNTRIKAVAKFSGGSTPPSSFGI